MYHVSVLLQACIDGLNIRPDGVYVDVTFGGGGHSKAILQQLNEKGQLFAFDQDADAARNVPDDQRLTFIPHNFRYIKNYLRLYGIQKVDGILADLGVSSHQFDEASRGFSIRFDGALDMRMNQQGALTADSILNTYEERDLARLFRIYGEVDNAGKLARNIVSARSGAPITSIAQFKEIIASCTPRHEESRYLAKVFQALRIEVNQEMEVLEEFLNQCNDLLKPGGRLVIMSYHSLEDRLVKNLMKTGNVEGAIEKDFFGKINRPYELITRKPMVPSAEEIEQNSRARSAKLRIAEKL